MSDNDVGMILLLLAIWAAMAIILAFADWISPHLGAVVATVFIVLFCFWWLPAMFLM